VTARLLLVRHGQTTSNLNMVLDSRPPGPPLTDLGRNQARELAGALADEPVVAVHASTAVRAQQTAAPLAARHGLSVSVLDGVHEVFLGDLEGHDSQEALAEFARVFGCWLGGDLAVPMPGGETGQQVLDRYLGAVHRVTDHQDGSVVVVSHGGAIRLAALALAQGVQPELARAGLLPNTGRVVLERDPATPTGWRCVAWSGLDLPASPAA
jgi:probable phosphoglycerate mutase